MPATPSPAALLAGVMVEERAVQKVRVFVSAGVVATLMTLLSVVTALAGDNTGPFPK